MRLKPQSRLSGVSKVVLGAAARASRLDHPSLIEVLDWGEFEDRPFVVTAPQGRTLGDLVRTGHVCEEHVAIGFTKSIAGALVYLHGLGLVYQNLDPGSAVVAADARSARLSWPVYCVPRGRRPTAPTASGSGSSSPLIPPPRPFPTPL